MRKSRGIKKRLFGESGASLLEYSLLVALISINVIQAVKMIGIDIRVKAVCPLIQKAFDSSYEPYDSNPDPTRWKCWRVYDHSIYF